MHDALRHYHPGDDALPGSGGFGRAGIRYRFEFDGAQPLPAPDYVFREAPVAVGTVELYRAQRWLVKSVDEAADPPVAVLRKVRS
jgi:hypothetical protein